ncbi:MAG: hypothetical protein PHG85_02285 [Candidatus Altiarchaeota archaeon]|nr:hypothetical protein [Candidatus Altiarchaeota archaeon]
MKSRLMEVYILQALYALPITLGWSFVLLYAFNVGFSYREIGLFYIIHYLTVIFVIKNLGTHRTFSLITASFICMMAGFLVLSETPSPARFYLTAIIVGTTAALFWIPYNITYFGLADKNATAIRSGLLFLVFPAVNTIIPMISGVVIDSLGFRILFLAAMAAALIPLWYARRIRDGSILRLDASKTIKTAAGVRTLMAIEGFWQGAAWMSLPLITFTYMQSGSKYGFFLAYMGIAGAISVLTLCNMSDRTGNRMRFIMPSAILAGLATIGAGLSDTFLQWMTANGLLSLFMAMTAPFTLSVIVDRIKHPADSMVSRELFLNAGRLAGVATATASAELSGSLRPALVIAGVVFLLYTLVLKSKKLYPKSMPDKIVLSDEAYDYKEV